MHRNLKNTKHWWLSWFRYETFITFFKFRFSTQGKRETQFFYADCSSIISSQLTDPTNARAHPVVHKPSLPGMTSFTSSVPFSIWGFYCDICDCHILPACAWTPALMSAPTHALSWKVLSLTKPKDKIYKMKNDNILKNPSTIIQQNHNSNILAWILWSNCEISFLWIFLHLFNLGLDVQTLS